MLRLFAGIALPPEHKLQLSTICHGESGIRWTDPGNFHVTIRFIGEVDEGVAADIDAALTGIRMAGFDLSIAGIGTFGPADKPRLIYAGLDKAPALAQLHDKVEMALMRAGLPPEGRRFTPHITLGTMRNADPIAVARFVATHNLLRLPPFRVDRFELIRSYLTKSGAVYEDVAEYPLR
jgi:2'-5' RNA ligase